MIAREDSPGDKRLTAYFVARDAAASSLGRQNQAAGLAFGNHGVAVAMAGAEPLNPSAMIEELSHLQQTLPPYMVPSGFVQLPHLPLTPNGKVDRKALPSPSAQPADAVFQEARDTWELQLAQVWKKVLRVEQVGANDNFFDRGGHSLSAVTLVAAIEKRFGIRAPLNIFSISNGGNHGIRAAQSRNSV